MGIFDLLLPPDRAPNLLNPNTEMLISRRLETVRTCLANIGNAVGGIDDLHLKAGRAVLTNTNEFENPSNISYRSVEEQLKTDQIDVYGTTEAEKIQMKAYKIEQGLETVSPEAKIDLSKSSAWGDGKTHLDYVRSLVEDSFNSN